MQVFYRKNGQLAGKKRKKEKKTQREGNNFASIDSSPIWHVLYARNFRCMPFSLFIPFLSFSFFVSFSLFFILTFPFRLPVFIEPFCGGKDDDSE